MHFLFELPKNKHLAKLIDVTLMTLLRSLLSKQMLFHNGPTLSKRKERPKCLSPVVIIDDFASRVFPASFFLKEFYPIHLHYQSPTFLLQCSNCSLWLQSSFPLIMLMVRKCFWNANLFQNVQYISLEKAIHSKIYY